MKAPAENGSRTARRRKRSMRAMAQLRTHDAHALAKVQAYREFQTPQVGGRLWRITPAADEVRHDLPPVRIGAMLGKIEALPGSDRELPADDRNMQRHAVDHGFHM